MHALRTLLALFSLLLIYSTTIPARELRFAPLPLEDKKVIHEQFQGLLDYLAQRTGHTLRMVHYNDYAEIVEAFQRHEIDLAYLGPLPYVILRKDFTHQQPLACFRDEDGEASYTCSLLVNADSGLDLQHLRGVHLGLTQPYSTCGYLAVTQMLGRVGIRLDSDGNRFDYAGSHSKAALGVVRGDYDVAGVKTSIGRRYLHMGLQEIAESGRFPGFTLVANTHNLSQPEVDQLREAILALRPAESEQDRQRMRDWGKELRHGAVAAAQCDYGSVEEILHAIPWPIPGAVQ